MSQDNAQNARQAADNRRRRWLWFVAIAVGAVAAVLLCLMGIGLLRSRGVDARLAAIEAARAVPDEDNAALIYAELTQGEELPLSNLTINVDAMIAVV